MPRPRLKTASLTVRIEPAVKEALAEVAHAERRSLANMLSVIILEWHKTHPATAPKASTKKTKKP